MSERKFQLFARVASANPSATKRVLEETIGNKGSIKPAGEGFEVTAEFEGESARDLNRMLLTKLRKIEKRTSIRSEWTSIDSVDKFFDYALKQHLDI
jgi:hypothetical protein